MPKKYKEYNIIKVPLKNMKIGVQQQTFPRIPRLYLELIENKDKIRQNLVGKEWVSRHIPEELYVDKFYDPSQTHNDISNQYNDYDISDSSEFSSDDNMSDSDIESVRLDKTRLSNDNSDILSDNSSVISNRLRELLEENDKEDYRSQSSISDKYSRKRDDIDISNKDYDDIPALSQLKENGEYVPGKNVVNLDQYHNDNITQSEDEQKREILFKFDLLKRSYPIAFIPEYTIHTELSILKRSYEDSVRRLSLDSSIENYKTYLIYGFMGCEFLFGSYFGFDMKGFTQQQITSMSSYEKILIELGEKNYVPEGSSWPVELRLVFLILMNTAFFIVSKSIMKKTGSNIMGMMNSMNSKKSTTPKRKMKGPKINLDDL
jgi:hypothetical protein